MCQRNCLGKQAAENASSSGSSVRRITAHMRQTRYLGTYLSERTAAAAMVGDQRFSIALRPSSVEWIFSVLSQCSSQKNLQMKTVVI